MYQQPRELLVLCEGKSEFIYLQELNRLFKKLDIPLIFYKAKQNEKNENEIIIKTGEWHEVNKKLSDIRKKKIKKKLKTNKIYILLDFDRYKRDGNRDKLNVSKDDEILWSYYNFEDFLILHLDRNINDEWEKICKNHNHFKKPMTSEDYEPLFKKFLREYLFKEEKKGYKKGTLPFELTEDRVKIMFANNTINRDKNTFYSDFGFFVQKLFKKQEKNDKD